MDIGGLLNLVGASFSMILTAWCVVKWLKGSPWFPTVFMNWCHDLSLLPMTFTDIQPDEEFIQNPYLLLFLAILYRLPSIANISQYAELNPYPNNRRMWMR
jgi:hypothetical protein